MTRRLVFRMLSNKSLRRAANFAGVGVLNTAIDLAIFSVLTQMGWLSPLPAHVVSFCVAAVNSFVLNTLITFRDRADGRWRFERIVRFGLVAIFSLMLSSAVLMAMLYFMPAIPAKLVSVLVVFAVSYALNAVVVFRKS